MFGVVAINIVRRLRLGPDMWFHKFWPLIIFLFIVVGAVIGVAGMVSVAIQRRTKNSN